MHTQKDIKPLMEWAKQNGDTKIIQRALVKLMPQLVARGQEITQERIENSERFTVDADLYERFEEVTKDLVEKG